MCATDGGGDSKEGTCIILVITRKPGESVNIDGPCVVTYLANEGGRIRLGFDAHKSVGIVRSDIDTRVPRHPPTKLYHPDTKPRVKLRGEGGD